MPPLPMNVDATCTRRIAAGLRIRLLALTLLWLLGLPVGAAQSLEVAINGLQGEPLANVQASLDVVRHSGSEALTAEKINTLHQQAEPQIRRALQPFGYYRPQISAQLQAPSLASDPWLASYTIDAGPAVPVTALEISFTGPGANDTELHALAQSLPLETDVTLDHRDYESARRSLLEQVQELGYLDAEYATHRVEVDMASYTAGITLVLHTGPQYVFGKIEFQQDTFAPDYLENYLLLEPGAPFSHALISRQRAALSKSGHFQAVTIDVGESTGGDQPALPVSIALTPYLANRYRGRVGWGTDTDFGVQLDWTRRHFGKRGHHFNLGGTAVQDRNRLAGDLSYMIPLDPLSGNTIELAARHESKDLTYQDVDLERGGETRIATNLASVIWHRPPSTVGNFQLKASAGVSLVEESYDVFEVVFGYLPNEDQEDFINNILGRDAYDIMTPDFEAIVPGLRLTLSRADDPLYIRRGDYFNLELLGAEDSLGSNVSFWQLRFNSWNIWPVGDTSRLLVRTAAGYTDADSDNVLGVNFNQVPEYFEFRTGGARSVRGYGFEELFPGDAITGGKHQLVASVEYEREIIPDFSAAVFLDAGNSFNDIDDFEEKLGAGIGLRWHSPVGLARIDLGFPLDDAEDSFQIYITVGPEF
jgi:translocation and assembly module TamA